MKTVIALLIFYCLLTGGFEMSTKAEYEATILRQDSLIAKHNQVLELALYNSRQKDTVIRQLERQVEIANQYNTMSVESNSLEAQAIEVTALHTILKYCDVNMIEINANDFEKHYRAKMKEVMR